MIIFYLTDTRHYCVNFIGVEGLEPPISCSQSRRNNHYPIPRGRQVDRLTLGLTPDLLCHKLIELASSLIKVTIRIAFDLNWLYLSLEIPSL